MTGRFLSLDAMRGIAAIAVVALHIGYVLEISGPKHAYLAVDFFFMLSGFVLDRAYRAKLAAMSYPRFMQIRCIRLFPLFALGIAFGAVLVAGRIATHGPDAMSPPQAALSFILNAAMLPGFDNRGHLFPFNAPAWSMFFELVCSVAFGLFLFRIRTAALAAIALAGAFGLFAAIVQFGHASFGYQWETAWAGAMRALFAFPAGVVISRLLANSEPRKSWWSAAPFAALAVILCGPSSFQPNWAYDALAVFVVFPVLVWAGATTEVPNRLAKIATALGAISYPIYAVHHPILQISGFIFVRRLGFAPEIVAVAFAAAILPFALAFAYWYDLPVRNWLNRKSKSRAADEAVPQPA